MSGARGYTTIEVMMALAILAVGTTGVVALQKVALIGNTTGRLGDAARGIGATWVERLKADAIQWNDPQGKPDLGETRFLKGAVVQTPGQPAKSNQWILAPEVLGWSSPVADVNGIDVFSGDDAKRGVFCTHLRLLQAVDKPIALSGVPHKIAIQAEVRVVWRRDLAPMTECRTTPPVQIEDNDVRYGFFHPGRVTILQQEASN
jgi:type IV pilus assembly protein PilV